ncbi:MAG: hypothetical protein Q9190_007179, partial [Brigantiaea leucoxantha]
MDPRASSQHPFSRPPSHQELRDLRYPPIPPPPPYSSRSSNTRPEILHSGDPFLRRTVESENPPSASTKPTSPYSVASHSRYTTNNLVSEIALRNEQARRNSLGSILHRNDGQGGRYGSQVADEDETEGVCCLDSGPWRIFPTPRFIYGTVIPVIPVTVPRHRSYLLSAAEVHPSDRVTNATVSGAHPSPSNPLPPPPPSSLFRSQPERRESRTASTITPSSRPSPAMFAADNPVPPPPPYSARMPPPLSPSHSQPQYQTQGSIPHVPQPPPSFSSSRDLPALPTSRPESSMSISSMLDSEPERPVRELRQTNHANGGLSTPSASHPPSTQTARTTSSPSQPNYNRDIMRQRSPHPEKPIQSLNNRPFRAYSNESQRSAPRNLGITSPQSARFPSSFTNTAPQQGSKPGPTPTTDWRVSYNRDSSTGRVVQRPNSQPSGRITSPKADIPPPPNSALSTADRFRDLQVAQKYEKLARDSRGDLSFGPADRDSRGVLEDRIRRVQEQRARALAAARQSPSRDSGVPLGIRGRFIPPNSSGNKHPREEIDNVDRVYNSDPRAFSNSASSPFSPDSLRQVREERLLVAASHQEPTGQPTPTSSGRLMQRSEDRQGHGPPRVSTSLGPNMNRSMSTNNLEHQNKISDEILQPQRHSIALLIENSKRGRVSPLPQAVQGAQGRNSGPASDPGIKNEFARMFSGIGSGVGSSGPMGSGNSTPFSSSPKVNHEPERKTPFAAARGDFNELVWQRQGSKTSKRRRVAKDDDSKASGDNGDNPVVIGSSGRVAKRKHGHHHQHHGHHRVPTTVIKNDAVLSSVAKLPSHHLGSTLYSPRLEDAFKTASLNDNPNGFSSIPSPLPRYEGKENCTLTLKVPRFYLEDMEREEITRRRALWGCEIYTDDSDPVAAAIHAGWIVGAWGPDIDSSKLEIDDASKPATTAEQQGAEEIVVRLDVLPSRPVIPPENKDMHLKLRVLPALEDYKSVTRHGIRSRSWGDRHDG